MPTGEFGDQIMAPCHHGHEAIPSLLSLGPAIFSFRANFPKTKPPTNTHFLTTKNF